MKKLIRDGKVAVLYSPGFGSGWFTENTNQPECLFDRDIAKAVIDNNTDLVKELCLKKWGRDFCKLGAENLCIEWLPVGTEFEIEVRGGNESIHVIGGRKYQVA